MSNFSDPILVGTGPTGLVTATLYRPAKANALTVEMLDQLLRLVQVMTEDSPGLVLQGGAGTFSGGIDLHAARERDNAGRSVVSTRLTEVCAAIRSCPAPVVAVVDGACVGGAVELAVSCDVRLGSQDARFRVPATEIGVLYRPEGLAALKTLAPATVRQLVLLGLELDATAAILSGILDRLIAVDDALRVAAELLERLRSVPGTWTRQKRALALFLDATGPNELVMTQLAALRAEHMGEGARQS